MNPDELAGDLSNQASSAFRELDQGLITESELDTRLDEIMDDEAEIVPKVDECVGARLLVERLILAELEAPLVERNFAALSEKGTEARQILEAEGLL